MDAGRFVRVARSTGRVPVRTLAARAHVAGSTVTRIQSGAVDPSVDTLERIIDAAGFELRIDVVRRGLGRHSHLADLTDAWTERQGRVRLAWTRWRALLDELALHPALVPEAIYPPPSLSGSDVVDSLLAAVAEKLADDAGLARPSWTRAVPALRDPYTPPVVRSVVGRAVPAQLEARGLLIDTESLWRDPETIGA